MRPGGECPRRRCDERAGDLVGDPGRRHKRGHAELRIEVKRNPRHAVGAQQPDGRELLIGGMICHSRECHRSRRLDGYHEKKLKLLLERPPRDMYPHPYPSRLIPGATFQDLDGSDHVGAPLRIAIDRGQQGKALLERCGHLR